MREATNFDDAVRSRLRSVLDPSVRDQPTFDVSTPVPPGWPSGDEGPLFWSDLIPSWPDDVDRAPSDAVAAPFPPVPAPSVSAPPASGSPVAAPPVSAPPVSAPPVSVPLVSVPLVSARPAAAFGPGHVFGGQEWEEVDGGFASGQADPGLRAAHVAAADDWRHGTGAVNPAGRIGLGAFDPGRRGVKALAAVAAVVVLAAAVLAWRARPRVDPVAPLPATVGAASTQTADGTTAGGATAGAGGPAGKAAPVPEVVVAVAGKVRKPGLVRLAAGARVADALQAAGGAEPGVDVALLNLARKVADGELILVGVTPPPGTVVATGAAGAPAVAGAAQGPVNLNTATLADLDTLPGVGPVLAQRILDARAAQGGFKAVSDLRKVDGIGDSRYEQLKDLVTV